MAKHTLNELGNMSREELITIILSMQGQLDALNENIEKLIEQVRLANSYRFGRHTETLKSIDGQLSFFDEAETLFDASAQEPSVEEAVVVTRKKKSKGQRELNLKAFPEEAVPVHSVSVEQLDAFYGKGCWRRMPDEVYKRVCVQPAVYTVEEHHVAVYAGKDNQTIVKADRPKELLRNSILTPSLAASILNAKYVNGLPLYRIS